MRIVTPGIPDKKMVFLLTQSYYGTLLQAGVRIFEYKPVCHAKSFVCDDEIATVGTINLDYRSSICILSAVSGCTGPRPCCRSRRMHSLFLDSVGKFGGRTGRTAACGPDFSSRFCVCLPRFCKTQHHYGSLNGIVLAYTVKRAVRSECYEKMDILPSGSITAAWTRNTGAICV